MENKSIQKAINVVGSQSKLAELLNVSQSAIHKWLTGKTKNIPLAIAFKIEKVTDSKVTIKDLMKSMEDE